MANLSYYIPFFSKARIDKTTLVVEVLSQFEYKDIIRFKNMTPRVFHGLLKLPYLRRKNFGDLIKRGKPIWSKAKDVYGAVVFIIQQNADIINRYVELKEKLDLATVVMHYDEAYELLKQIESEI